MTVVLSHGCCGCFEWVSKSTTPWCPSKAEFIGWWIFGVLSFIAFIEYLKDENEDERINIGYIFSASMSIATAFYGLFVFRHISKLHSVLNKLMAAEKNVRTNLVKVQGDTQTLQVALRNLSVLEDEAAVVNAQLRTQRKLFMKWSKLLVPRMQRSDSHRREIRMEMEFEMRGKQREIERNERQIICNAFRVFERDDDGLRGLNMWGFRQFVKALPERYRTRLKESRRTFYSFDKDADGIIKGTEFEDFLDFIVSKDAEAVAGGFGIDLPQLETVVSAPIEPDPVSDEGSLVESEGNLFMEEMTAIGPFRNLRGLI